MLSSCRRPKEISSGHEFRFKVGGASFPARYLPARTDTTPLVVLVPGSGPCDVDGSVGNNPFLRKLAIKLTRVGISTLRFGKLPVAGRYTIKDYRSEYLRPLHALLDWAQSNLRLRDRVVALLGHSLGGHVVPWLANQLPFVSGIIVVNAHVSPLPEIVSWQLKKYHGIGIEQMVWASECSSAQSHALQQYFDRAKELLADVELSLTHLPLLCLVSGRDSQISPEEHSKWQEIIRNYPLNRKLVFFPSLNHVLARVNKPDPMSIYQNSPIAQAPILAIKDWISNLQYPDRRSFSAKGHVKR